MTNAQTGTLVLKDQAGSYFLVPQAALEEGRVPEVVLEQGRVPEEGKAAVERRIADAEGDVSGYSIATAPIRLITTINDVTLVVVGALAAAVTDGYFPTGDGRWFKSY